MCFDFLYKVCLKYVSSNKYLATYKQKLILFFILSNLYSCQILLNLEFYGQSLEKSLNIKFNENPSSRRRVVPCGLMDGRTDRRTDMMKLTVSLRNFTNAPKLYRVNEFSVQVFAITYLA